MAQQVCSGALVQCSFGTTPSTLSVLPKNRVAISAMPAANIMDHASMVNIQPLGMCTTPSNPAVASATAAASGVLTPMPCMPVTSALWTPGCVKVNVGGQPALTNTCQLMCSYGGVITIVNPGQQKVNAP